MNTLKTTAANTSGIKATPRMPKRGEYVRGLGTFLRKILVKPPPPPKPEEDYIFEEISARCEVVLNGDVLLSFNSVWDAYGKESSVQDAIKSAQHYATKNRIGARSDIEVIAIRSTQLVRKRPIAKDKNFYDDSIVRFEPLERGSTWGLPEPKEDVVWTSRKPDLSEKREL